MTTTRLTSPPDTASSIEPAAVADLRPRFRGALLRPGEEGYDEARRVWNGAIDRRPAPDRPLRRRRRRRRGRPLRPRARPARLGARRRARRRRPRRLRRRAHDRPLADEDDPGRPGGAHRPRRRRRPLGRARPRHPAVRPGHHRRDHQPHRHRRADPRRRARPPDAQARPDRRQPARRRPRHRRRRARCTSTPSTEPELFWGLRGGGGNFGIATALRVPAAPGRPDGARRADLLAARRGARRSCAFLRDFAPSAPDELGHHARHRSWPRRRRSCRRSGTASPSSASSSSGPATRPRAQAAIAPLRQIGSPIADVGPPDALLCLQSMLDGGAPHGRHYYWKAHRLPDLTDDVIDIFLDRVERRSPSPFSQISGWAVGGAVSRVDPDATAVGERELGFEINITAAWPPADPDGDATSPGCARAGRRCARTAPASTPTSSPTRAPRRRGRLRPPPPRLTASRTATTRQLLPPEQQHHTRRLRPFGAVAMARLAGIHDDPARSRSRRPPLNAMPEN